MIKRFLVGCLVLLLITAAALAAAGWYWVHKPMSLAAPSVELSIEPGTSPRQIAQGWVDAGVQAPAFLLYEWFRWSGEARKIRAGSYELSSATSPADLLRKMVRGDETLATVRLIEGWSFRQFRAELAKADGLVASTAGMSDEQLMATLDAAGRSPEGWFFPDTYAYSKGTNDVAVLQRAHRAMQRQLDAAWAARSSNLPLKSADEALILASIVEKETGQHADRGRVAGVFINRLRLGMPLQTDPTVIYGIGPSFDGNLRRRDLRADTPYNTYTRAGLPPTPIAMPGKAALLAVVQPEPTKALYFVSRGDGSSEFSETLDQHNRAVNKYQRGGGS